MAHRAPLQENSSEEERRVEALNRYIAGERPTAICRRLGRSRIWFYKVIRRYQQYGRPGLRDQSRAPHRQTRRIAVTTEAAIVRLRETLTSGQEPELRYSNIGAETIATELDRAG